MTLEELREQAANEAYRRWRSAFVGKPTYPDAFRSGYHAAALPAPVALPQAGEVERARQLYQAVTAGEFETLDAVADKWLEEAGVQRMSNAIASVFEQYAPQEIMDRFREKITALMHLAFVEGAGQGVLQIGPVIPTPTETPTAAAPDDGLMGRYREALEAIAEVDDDGWTSDGHERCTEAAAAALSTATGDEAQQGEG